jgi:hypothetical protein
VGGVNQTGPKRRVWRRLGPRYVFMFSFFISLYFIGFFSGLPLINTSTHNHPPSSLANTSWGWVLSPPATTHPPRSQTRAGDGFLHLPQPPSLLTRKREPGVGFSFITHRLPPHPRSQTRAGVGFFITHNHSTLFARENTSRGWVFFHHPQLLTVCE